jgi:hypothetical protein
MNPRISIACLLALVFAAGAASDMAARRLRDRNAQSRGGTSWAELVRAMNLSPQQQHQIDSLFATYQPRSDALLRELAPRLRALADSMHADLLPLLDPAQREVLARAQHRQLFMLRRKTLQGERVDTIRLQPRDPP